ncbi:hypothetical protein I6N91_15245 [Arthrobacter sp. MSA 4-2]|uniref:hypothetical protein n=1 Tax=Arthrobacter sp. MSA 4-2 TaxID=2794349 RepID=UPI0018E742E6|nr:hypothetical protein [Arthrobacter sp. MSA 4-2]MBJ2122337.1 hypothetical protein [Arthrobacter sp. MSA 4-2]
MSKANDEKDPRPAASGRGSSAVSGIGTAGGVQRRSRRAADAPVDAEVHTSERVSLVRARDREALRTYRALAEHSVPAVASSYDAMPTRRQLRLQQQEAQAARAEAPATAPGGTVQGDSAPAASTAAASTAAESASDASTRANASDGSGAHGSAGAAPSGARTAPETAAPHAEGRPLHPDGTPIERRIAQVPLEGRRDRRRRVSTEGDGAAGPQAPGAAPAGQGAVGEDLSIEQALAAREAIAAQARDQVAMIEAAQGADPFAVDPAILAKQKALAERAAVLNSRAQKIQQLSEENSQRRPQSSDPTTAHNLSIVAPPEYVKVPGVGGPVLKAPTTSHVPVVRRPLPSKPSAQPAAPASAPASTGKGPERRSQVLAQAETLARNHGRATDDGATPVRAQSAHGLDPLDAMTAGLARVRRMRYLQFSILGLGVLALLAGILMIVSGFGG